MSEFTKGPWKSRHKDYAIWDGNNCRWVVVTAPKRGEIGRFKRDNDAVLASAAPDLLEALEAVLSAEPADGAYLIGETESEKAAYAKARAAIAKAKGEQV